MFKPALHPPLSREYCTMGDEESLMIAREARVVGKLSALENKSQDRRTRTHSLMTPCSSRFALSIELLEVGRLKIRS
jgi:hypothetical protein